MAELTLKRRGEYIQGVLRILVDHPEGIQAKDVLRELTKQLPPTSFESADFPNHPGVRRFEKYVRFTSISPVKFGWMTKTKGRWAITDWVAPPGPDDGVDIVAYTDPLGMTGPRLKVQVKRRFDRVGAEELRSFLSVLGENDRGLYVAIGGFTADAQTKARGQEKRQITLVDLEKLFDLWVEHYDKIEDSDRRLLPLRPIHYLVL